MTDLDFDSWVGLGLRNGWIGPPVCISHEALPISNVEFENNDLCAMMIRIYESPEQRKQIEADHIASVANREMYE